MIRFDDKERISTFCMYKCMLELMERWDSEQEDDLCFIDPKYRWFDDDVAQQRFDYSSFKRATQNGITYFSGDLKIIFKGKEGSEEWNQAFESLQKEQLILVKPHFILGAFEKLVETLEGRSC